MPQVTPKTLLASISLVQLLSTGVNCCCIALLSVATLNNHCKPFIDAPLELQPNSKIAPTTRSKLKDPPASQSLKSPPPARVAQLAKYSHPGQAIASPFPPSTATSTCCCNLHNQLAILQERCDQQANQLQNSFDKIYLLEAQLTQSQNALCLAQNRNRQLLNQINQKIDRLFEQVEEVEQAERHSAPVRHNPPALHRRPTTHELFGSSSDSETETGPVMQI